MFTTITIKGNDYKLKLNAGSCIALEKKLKTNPINVLKNLADSETIPNLEDLISILHYSLQAYHHGFDFDKTCALYDDFIEEGHTMVDLIPVMVDVFISSGLIKVNDKEEEEEKN